jgi:hypothetical protein
MKLFISFLFMSVLFSQSALANNGVKLFDCGDYTIAVRGLEWQDVEFGRFRVTKGKTTAKVVSDQNESPVITRNGGLLGYDDLEAGNLYLSFPQHSKNPLPLLQGMIDGAYVGYECTGDRE